MNKEINDFLEYLEITRGLSRATLINYNHFLKRFNEFAKTKGISKPGQISKELIQKYRIFLNRLEADGGNLKKNTQNYHIIALRAFLKYLIKNDIKTLEPEKIELLKQHQRQVDFLDEKDLEQILKAPLQIDSQEIIQARDKSILELLFSTGLRVSELANLKIDTINLSKDEFSIRGKGGKIRLVFISESARNWIKKYLKIRKDMNPGLFIAHDKIKKNNTNKKNLTPRSIQRIVQKYAKIAGLTKQVTPHTMRHSYATDLLINGADIRSVQSMLGHSSITTTQVYTHITDNRLRDVHRAFHGKNRKK